MRYIFYLIGHIEEMHPAIQLLIYGACIAAMVGVLVIGQGKYF